MDREHAAFRAMSDAVLAIAAESAVGPILQRLVHSARELVEARYAALGVPDGDGGFAQFITSGMSAEEIAALGPLPRTHGLLGAMLAPGPSYRTADIQDDPRFRGWWPDGHPDMRSFLGVPIVSGSGLVGAFYVTDKLGAPEFDEADQELIEMLAAHAAVAIENARAFDLSRRLSVIEERNRLARELHDAITQRLFSLGLTADAALALLDRDPPRARAQLERVRELAGDALEELRTVIAALRPARLESEGLAVTLGKQVELLARSERREISFETEGSGAELDPARAAEVLRIAQEALQNAIHHARAQRIWVRLAQHDQRLQLEVGDDGRGFDAGSSELRATRLGLTSMEERAAQLGGRLEIDSAPGAGTRIALEVGA